MKYVEGCFCHYSSNLGLFFKFFCSGFKYKPSEKGRKVIMAVSVVTFLKHLIYKCLQVLGGKMI